MLPTACLDPCTDTSKAEFRRSSWIQRNHLLSENRARPRRWAVGVLLYEMLAGYPPWQDGNTYAVYRAVLGGRLSFPHHFDPDAQVPLQLPNLP